MVPKEGHVWVPHQLLRQQVPLLTDFPIPGRPHLHPCPSLAPPHMQGRVIAELD